jgi:D-alanyl-D-alanine carboxypeptidase
MDSYRGMDGIKTGYIGPSGFNLAASVKRDGHRLIGVVFGGQSARWRDQRMTSLLNAAFTLESNSAVPVPTPAPRQQSVTASPISAPGPVTGEGDVDTDTSAALNPSGAPTPQVPGAASAGIMPAAGAPPILRTSPAAPTQTFSTAAIAPGQASQTNGRAGGAPDLTHAWGVQVGAYSDRGSSDAALRAVMATLPPSLRHAAPAIAPLQTVDGVVYRARLNGFTRAEALSVCSRITNCLTVSPYANN